MKKGKSVEQIMNEAGYLTKPIRYNSLHNGKTFTSNTIHAGSMSANDILAKAGVGINSVRRSGGEIAEDIRAGFKKKAKI